MVGWRVECGNVRAATAPSASTRRQSRREREALSPSVVRAPYARFSEMWRNSVGNVCIPDVQNLKEAIPSARNRFC